MKAFWSTGDKARLAEAAGVSLQYLSDLLSRRRRASPDLARKLSDLAATMDKSIPVTAWLYPDVSHPAFRESK